MSVIVPAILPASKKDLEHKLTLLEGLTDAVQIDLVDGQYAAPPTWPYTERVPDAEGEPLPYYESFAFELDLMVVDAKRTAESWIDSGVTRLTIHVPEAEKHTTLFEDLKARYGHDADFLSDMLSIGLAIQVETDLAHVEPYIDNIEYVQFMGISAIGRQGEPFDTRILSSIETFRRKYPDMPVQVDGGVNLSTAPLLLAAGVSRLIIGSALWNAPDLEEALAQFHQLTEEHGLYRT